MTFCAVCVHILIFSIFCSTRIGITIRCIKYFAFRRIASKLMKLWYKTWDHWSFFVDFSIKIFIKKWVVYYLGEIFRKKCSTSSGKRILTFQIFVCVPFVCTSFFLKIYLFTLKVLRLCYLFAYFSLIYHSWLRK